MNIAAVILAAGRGTRAGEGLPKTYRPYRNSSVLRHVLGVFIDHPGIGHIQTVIHADDRALYEECVKGLDLPAPVIGGATRALSVLAGLDALDNPDAVLIHDGARPHLDQGIIDRIIAEFAMHDGAIPALPVVDALWQSQGDLLQTPIDRAGVLRAQTPQGFRFAPYYAAIKANPDGLDDAQIAVGAGMRIAWVEGSADNVKLTYAEDFE